MTRLLKHILSEVPNSLSLDVLPSSPAYDGYLKLGFMVEEKEVKDRGDNGLETHTSPYVRMGWMTRYILSSCVN
jgi:hypothetical protein